MDNAFDVDAWGPNVRPYQEGGSPHSGPPPDSDDETERRRSRSPHSANERNEAIQRPSKYGTNKLLLSTQWTWRWEWPSPWFLLFASILGSLAYMAFQEHHDDRQHDETDCLWILSSARSLSSFPLPHTIDEPKHRDVLHEHFPRTLDDLLRTRSEVYSNLLGRAQRFNQHLANAAKLFTHSHHEYSKDAFQTDMALARTQLEAADSQMDALATVYYRVKGAYITVNATAAIALEKAKLTNQTEFWCNAQSWGLLKLGFNNIQRYRVPWNEKLRKMEEVRSGFVALEREIGRLEQIRQVVQKVDHTLQDLSDSLLRWDIESPPEGPQVPLQRRLREWFQQNFVRNRRLQNIWSELLASVDKGEPKFDMAISTDWCIRSQQADEDGG